MDMATSSSSVKTSTSVNDEIKYYRHSSFANHVGKHFLIASAAGAGLYSVIGHRCPPNLLTGLAIGGGSRLAGAARAGGGFIGAYSALYYAFEGAMVSARGGRHDRWNPAAAGAAAMGLLHYVPRAGFGVNVASAVAGAALGGMFGDVFTSFSKIETPGHPSAPSS